MEAIFFCLSAAAVLNSSFELSCIPEERRGVLSYMDCIGLCGP